VTTQPPAQVFVHTPEDILLQKTRAIAAVGGETRGA
jgi:hypothetical protein